MKYFLPMLAILFITLKLTHVIAWSWWLVLLPLYGWIPLVDILIIVGTLITAIGKRL